ncbi:SPA1-related 4-like protein isoform X1, partial [Tanacetum coccineum]
MGVCSSLGRNQYEKDCGNLPQKVSQNSWLQSRSENMGANNVQQTKEKKHRFPMKIILQMETGWYTSLEEAAGAPSSRAFDVYRLGVLFLEALKQIFRFDTSKKDHDNIERMAGDDDIMHFFEG